MAELPNSNEGGPERWTDRGRAWLRVVRDEPVDCLDRRNAVWTLVYYVVGVLAFATAAFAIEIALGDPVISNHLPGSTKSFYDALWHLFTGFAIALPLRNRIFLVVAPLLALGVDFDHVYGGVLPTVVYRESHNLLFLVLIAAVLAYGTGRFATLAVPGGLMLHIGVDGGAFPFFAPVTTQTFGLTFSEGSVFVVAGATLLFLSVRPARDLLRPRFVVPWILAIVVVIALIPVIPGGILQYN